MRTWTIRTSYDDGSESLMQGMSDEDIRLIVELGLMGELESHVEKLEIVLEGEK
jgi:hypothetical protein